MTDQTAPQPAAAPRRTLPRALTPFRHAAYRRLAMAIVLSSLASGMWIIGLVWEVIRIGGGPGQLSLVTTASAVGVLLPALLGGVVADRVPQKLILMAVAGIELAGMAVVAVLSRLDLTTVGALMAVSFVTGMGMAFYYPAYSAWLPALVPSQDLMAVNGFEGMVRPTVGQAIGPAVAGAAVAAVSPAAALGLAAVASLGGLLVLSTVPRTPVRREGADDGDAASRGAVAAAVHDIREGFGYMLRTPWLLATLLFASVMTLVVMGPLEVLVPFLIKERLGGEAGDHAMVLAAFGVGGAVGSLVMSSLPMPRRYLSVMNLVWGISILPFIVIGLATEVWHVVAAAFVVGVLFSAPMVIWGTLLQRRVPPHLLGRVASLDFFVGISLMPISMALAGPISDLVGTRTTFLVAAVVPAVAAVAAVLLFGLPADELAHPLRDEDEADEATDPVEPALVH